MVNILPLENVRYYINLWYLYLSRQTKILSSILLQYIFNISAQMPSLLFHTWTRARVFCFQIESVLESCKDNNNNNINWNYNLKVSI